MSNSSRKITFIGAGSTVFAKNLLGDILSFPELGDSTICLFDINESRLKTSEVVARRIAQTLGAPARSKQRRIAPGRWMGLRTRST
jgi:alpha-galactosidase